MIKLTDNLENYILLFQDDVFFNRIYSDYKTMSCFNDVMFYICEDNDTPKAVISKIGGVLTVSALESAPFDEIDEFVKVIGYSVILCDDRFAVHFDGYRKSGSILRIKKDVNAGCKAEKLYTENLKDVYELIKNTFVSVPDFTQWFADMCHLVRNNAAQLCGVYENNQLVSVGFSLFAAGKSAVISSVATRENFRKKGYGERVVKTLISLNSGKDVFVFTENDNISNWYKKMGFVPYKKWSEIVNVL